jgi:SAM-dependent methyltransferase
MRRREKRKNQGDFVSDELRAQYEAFPYPARDPADEAKRLITGSPSHIVEIDHYVFGGRRDWSRPFRALIAGGGTGDAAIMLAQQLADARCPAEVLHLDLSESSQAIARARAAARGLTNLRFAQGSLLEAEGPYDYIDCCGVLHHLEDPAAGAVALARALAPDGGLGAMVYAPLGRDGVYPLQEALRLIAGAAPPAERLTIARAAAAQLPATHPFTRNPFVSDHKSGDAGFYDLLLNPIDRPFTVRDVAALAEGAGLRLTAFIEPARYRPESFVADAALLARLPPDDLSRAAFAELWAGNMRRHIFYAVRADNRATLPPRHDDPAAIPVPVDFDPARVARGLSQGQAITAEFDGLKLRFAPPPLAGAIAAAIDGRRTLAEIHRALDPPHDWLEFIAAFDALFAAMNGINRLFVRFRPDSPS